jgi:phosphoribosylanthranilate isomerase
VADAEPDGEAGGAGKKINGRTSAKLQVDAQLVALAGGLGGDEEEVRRRCCGAGC